MENKKEILLSYIKANVAPILVDFISSKDLDDAVVIPANVDIKELNGHYDGVDFVPPKWLNEILNTNASRILVIDKIDSISKEEQLKFCELLEHRKISTFELPKSCVIIVTANKINKNNNNKIPLLLFYNYSYEMQYKKLKNLNYFSNV